MTDTDKKLYELLGDKTLDFWPDPTIADVHKWMNDNKQWAQNPTKIIGNAHWTVEWKDRDWTYFEIPYDSSKSLLLQSEETKLAIINLIKANVKV